MRKAPSTLDAIAVEKWNELAPELPDGSQAMLDSLEQYAVAWSRWQQATDDDARLRWSRCVRQWLQELRPRSRKADRPGDPLLQLIKGDSKHG